MGVAASLHIDTLLIHTCYCKMLMSLQIVENKQAFGLTIFSLFF